MARRPVCGDWACQSHATFVARRSVFQAHPRRWDDIRLVLEGAAMFAVLFVLIVAASVTPT